MEHENDGDTECNWYTWNDSKGFVRELSEFEIDGRAEIIQTTELLKSA